MTAIPNGLFGVIARKNAGGGLSPSDLGSYSLGLKASLDTYTDAGTTPTADTDLVYQWSDQSGAGNNALQTTSTRRPAFETNGINSLDTVDFEKSRADYLVTGNSGSSAQFTIISVIKIEAISANNQFIFGADASGGFGLAVLPGGKIGILRVGQALLLETSASAVANGGSYVVACRRDASKNLKIWINGSTTTGSDTGTFTASLTGEVGSNRGGADPFDGFISELHVYDTDHSDADIESVMATLNAEYSIY